MNTRRPTLDYLRSEPDTMKAVQPMLGEQQFAYRSAARGCLIGLAVLFAVATVGTVLLMVWEWWWTGRIRD